MKKVGLLFIGLFISLNTIVGQNTSSEAKSLLDEVSTKMGAYKNMIIGFNSSLVNREAGITNDPPIRGKITLSGEKYNLDYLGNHFLFDGKKLVVINQEEKEISVTNGDLDEEDGFIYPSKLLTFYKEGYNFSMGKLKNSNGRKIQFVDLTPIDSNSDIIKVQLGIDAKTKHIYKLVQIGSNGAETTFTITKFKSNQPISKNLFSFDKEKYLKQGYFID
ncbi:MULTISPECIES: LolA family protein [unclassified Tenacibaculum]|uniref:LolA family protein n=1 Tax=unclassified Tenacibaculum TaxID=2635139 RepID=UPI001F3C678C|nr:MULTISPECIES: outer membrane lipoprotein carrier protein LolA [unclassified Tenacibaculum]MCF2873981.1 outer membrane lipoprotein carrier protein LolA [Tenacibaculum sp. Cn5-1]MCF2934562.1 outer membrane lipoprotein carrier protein LolA [Tenacibaculum sp. Cn5-34]MCG7510772.1 outer membrane lipoprotein carrier protein LolA [Tenacibaculum sp. Cn5-46]